MDFLRYLDPIKDRLVIFMELLKEKLAPLLERLEFLPYYPYSVLGTAAVILLLLILLLLSRKRSGAKTQKTKADPDHPRPRVSGVAVGLSSHEEFKSGGSYSSPSGDAKPSGNAAPSGASAGTAKISGRSFEPETVMAAPIARPPVTVAPVMNTPPQPVPIAAEPAVIQPEVTAPPAPALTPPAAEPVSAGPQDPELEEAIKSCQENFQSVYMGMYVQFGFMSDFETFKVEVVKRLGDAKITHRAISELKMTPQGLVLAQMASVSGNFLQSGQYHTGKGQMDQQGQELLTIYRYALNTMRDASLASPADVQNKLDFMARKVLEIGG